MGDLKEETEDRALRTNAIKASIEKQDVSPLCRMCQQKNETIDHLICKCSKKAQIKDFKIGSLRTMGDGNKLKLLKSCLYLIFYLFSDCFNS